MPNQPIVASAGRRWRPDRLNRPPRDYRLGGPDGEVINGWVIGRGSSRAQKARWNEIYIYKLAFGGWAVERVACSTLDNEGRLWWSTIAATHHEVLAAVMIPATAARAAFLSDTGRAALNSATRRDQSLEEVMTLIA